MQVFFSCILATSSFTNPCRRQHHQPRQQYHHDIQFHRCQTKHTERKQMRVKTNTSLSLSLSPDEQQLAFWITSFSTLHIGMSAIRDSLIKSCGQLAQNANLIDRKIIQLPLWWPGDDVGKNEIFPDGDTAGRQIYRLGYTFVSFFTLGGALASYLSIVRDSSAGEMNFREQLMQSSNIPLTDEEYMVYFIIASASFAASIASLFNASPLSLMPGFQKEEKNEGLTSTTNLSSAPAVVSIAGIQRKDELKFEPKGLTRITRHPLILPVVPWGIATSFLVGGNTADFILFGGLSLYAIAGCACQDLRIIKKEGSVGTVFQPLSSSEVGGKLDDFFSATSFIPFGAVVDGRQPISLLVKEFPLLPFIIGFPVGGFIENALLNWLN
jgi:hypothetical protein